ncbi:serine/threonine protein kinase [Leptolyngbya cf. ectocarpi LEGE 11479]|uniref:Serine/threonine protein kinase n=1 Tax=Leptolyngbya cf. ectocarpi LEGE 11479 TaxID=1828722 RepID=A0A928WZZ6_LEPEC|nr:serine/threonine-protein kinase [Leptolyngbya ectocarpi]MBE9066489.1 serine/threonine protein kinase [Leptolyngbya cf. ectocarpi LEGE 11479]
MVSTRALQPPRLHNRYSIQHTLGARLGRRTLLGYDHSRSCQVVIKYLCVDDPLMPKDIDRFRTEIAVLKTLDHPSIPAYLDDFEVNEQGYNGLMLVQAYIEGQSLYALVNAQRQFAEPELRSLARQMLEILDYLHHHQPIIIHRDIKPSSLVLGTSSGTSLGHVYLVDLGLVQYSHQQQTAGSQAEPILISGTPGYRPPEQLGDRAVPATDLYSLGATLVHLATGQHPSHLPQRGLRILFSQELGHVSRPLKSWLRWLTQPKQHKRPGSVQSALYGLEQADKIFAPQRLSLGGLGHCCQRALLETMAPAKTQLKLLEYSQTLEVLLPPLGWKNLQFCLVFLQTVINAVGVCLVGQGLLYLWPQLIGIGQQLLTTGIGIGWIYLSLRWGYRGAQTLVTMLLRQISIQLLPDIILLGYRFPCRPVDYQINTYKQDIEDIDLQPGGSTIMFHLRRNRTIVGKLDYALVAKDIGVTQSEICWINDILQLWLKQGVSQTA